MDAPLPKTPPSTPPRPPRVKGQPRRKTTRQEWPTPIRQRINDLQYTKPCRKPQAITNLTGVPRTSVIEICERDESLLRRERPTRANKYKIPREKVLEIEADMDGCWGKGSMETQEVID